jgi:hypothetical protein
VPLNHTVTSPSPAVVSQLRASEGWTDGDVVIEGTDTTGRTLSLTRREAKVSTWMVRGWLRVRDRSGQPRMRVVRSFVAADGALFTPHPD